MNILEGYHKEGNEWINLFTKSDNAGFRFVSHLKKINGNRVPVGTKSFPTKDIESLANFAYGKTDRYLTMNSYKDGHCRKQGNLNKFEMLGIDLDIYHKALSIDEALKMLQQSIDEGLIPMPNLVLKSHGLQVFYCFKEGVADKPNIRLLWPKLMLIMSSKLDFLGGDTQVHDAARLLRIPNTINTNNNSWVEWKITNPEQYHFNDLVTFFSKEAGDPNYGKKTISADGIKSTKGSHKELEDKESKKFVFHVNKKNKEVTALTRAMTARVHDYLRLLAMRNYDMTGYRNVFVYQLSYAMGMLFTDGEMVSKEVAKIVNKFAKGTHSFTPAEFIKTFNSGFYNARDFIVKQGKGSYHPQRSKDIADILGMTDEEKSDNKLKTLCSPEVKHQRKIMFDRISHRKARLRKGMRPMADIQKERDERVERFVELKNENPTWVGRQFAEALGVSQATISGYRKRAVELAELKKIEKDTVGHTVDNETIVEDTPTTTHQPYPAIKLSKTHVVIENNWLYFRHKPLSREDPKYGFAMREIKDLPSGVVSLEMMAKLKEPEHTSNAYLEALEEPIKAKDWREHHLPYDPKRLQVERHQRTIRVMRMASIDFEYDLKARKMGVLNG